MSDKRPLELIQQQEEATNNNNALIVSALLLLENDAESLKLKATVATLCELTGLSRNTIRTRAPAMARLKEIKQARRLKRLNPLPAPEAQFHQVPVEEELRAQVVRVLEQNALLYDEILFLRSQLKSKELEIEIMKPNKLKLA